MNDARGVGGGERARDLSGVLQRLRRRQASSGSQVAQRFSADVFHYDALHVSFRDNVIQGNDVGMVEGRSRLRFLEETALALGVGGQAGRQNFYRHQTIEPVVLRLVDFAHSAGANLVDQLVVKDLFADHGANGALTRIMTRMAQPAQSGP